MRLNRLQLNAAKTEILWPATNHRLHQLPKLRSESVCCPLQSERPIGILLDSDMLISSHVTKTVSTCFAVLMQLRSIQRSVSRPVVHVVSRLDYGNATLADIPQHLLRRLQSVMNAAARLIYSSSRFNHITPLLRQLHWLKEKERIDYKLAVLVFKWVHGSAPPYIANERPADFQALCRLRSASSSILVVRRTRHTTVGDRSFPVVASRVWNNLPQHVISSSSLRIFKNRLKTYLCSSSFP